MTSSDSDSLPRNKEFFFSRNRLNVVISRAQVASIILFNPNLLDSSPKNLDHIKLMIIPSLKLRWNLRWTFL